MNKTLVKFLFFLSLCLIVVSKTSFECFSRLHASNQATVELCIQGKDL